MITIDRIERPKFDRAPLVAFCLPTADGYMAGLNASTFDVLQSLYPGDIQAPPLMENEEDALRMFGMVDAEWQIQRHVAIELLEEVVRRSGYDTDTADFDELWEIRRVGTRVKNAYFLFDERHQTEPMKRAIHPFKKVLRNLGALKDLRSHQKYEENVRIARETEARLQRMEHVTDFIPSTVESHRAYVEDLLSQVRRGVEEGSLRGDQYHTMRKKNRMLLDGYRLLTKSTKSREARAVSIYAKALNEALGSVQDRVEGDIIQGVIPEESAVTIHLSDNIRYGLQQMLDFMTFR